MESVVRNIRRLNTACWTDYLLVTLIVALTGFEFCYNLASPMFFIVGPLALVMFVNRQRGFSQRFCEFFILLFLWSLLQVWNNQSVPSAVFNMMLRFFIYYLAASAVNEFEKVFVRIIWVISVVAIICWLIWNFLPGGHGIMSMFPTIDIGGGLDKMNNSNPGRCIGFYYLSHSIRNSGPFWEPGMFVVFLSIALAFRLLRMKTLRDKYAIVFLFAIFSTLSTTGTVAAIFIIGWYYSIIDFKPKSFVILILTGIVLLTFLESDFGQSKIENQMSSSESFSRFGAVAYHFSLLKDFWFIGRGFASDSTQQILTSPNGLSLIFLFWGIPFAVYYYIVLFSGAKKVAVELVSDRKILKSAILIFMVLLIVAFSQDVTTRHFYYFFLMYALNPIRRKLLK